MADEETAECSMTECVQGSVPIRVFCILTYGGSEKDVLINYVLVLLNLLSCFSQEVTSAQHSFSWAKSLGSLVFVICFQITLCLIVGCSGISIIWCAMAGWILCHLRRRLQQHQESTRIGGDGSSTRHGCSSYITRYGVWIVLGIDFMAILYYLITMELITTIAHCCALILGALLCRLSLSSSSPSAIEDHEPPPSSEAALLQSDPRSYSQFKMKSTLVVVERFSSKR